MGVLPTTYLGLPFGAPLKAFKMWDAVEDRFWKRLALEKAFKVDTGEEHPLLLTNLFHGSLCLPKEDCCQIRKKI